MKKQSDSDNQIWNISELLKWTADYFQSNNIESPRMGAELLLSHCLNVSRLNLYLQYDKPLLPEELRRYKLMIKRRIAREPVAYITGYKGFWTLDLAVSKNVLVPRPDTECLVETALEMLRINPETPLNVLDLGTGSGAIILSLASEMPINKYFAVDVSVEAIKVAKQNAELNCPERNISFISSSWFDGLVENEMFDLIVSNPPYIPTKDIMELEPEIKEYEPFLALDGDVDGLKCVRHIIEYAGKYLRPGGWLMIETGFDQKEAVLDIAYGVGGYSKVEYIRDFAGNNRVVRMQKTALTETV